MRKELKEQLDALKSTPTEEVKTEPVYTQKAFGFFKDLQSGFWHVAEIQYNEAGETSVMTKSGPLEDKTMAIETFQIKVANDVL